MGKTVKCPACTSEAYYELHEDLIAFFQCPVCGKFELKYPVESSPLDRNHLASYLVYHCYEHGTQDGKTEYRYHTVRDKETCDKYRQEFDRGNNIIGRPVHMDADIIENWYPKTFAERTDYILLYIAKHTKHVGQKLSMPINALLSVLFVDKQEFDYNIYSQTKGQWVERKSDEYIPEVLYMLRYLEKQNYIDTEDGISGSEHSLRLTPEGYARVDKLQKNTASGRSVLVAMKFGDDTLPLRKAIKKGITDAGYVPILIDEVQHNDFITPELLKHIRDSKFVVVDLTHKNNGAYFEEGYAMGLGKPVIQLCKHGVQLHFDIAQKNTIMWDTEEDIPERLCNRIKATIE